jgi:ATP-binding cassette subfamily B protein/subfamily B ATP-binding cassette protein MsbA
LVLYEPLQTLGHLAATVAAAEASAQRVFEVLDCDDTVPEPTEIEKSHVAASVRGHVAWRNVTFSYEPGQPVLRDIDLEIQPGERVAIVGQTGAGKSTLISLLLRFFDPSQGSVLLDGVDLRHMSKRDLRSQIAILLQEPFILPVSVAENIAYGRKAGRDAIVAAANAANADEFIARLPQGYDTLLGERGVTLSGGERQRIAIARALVKDAPILILDEPTSALDVRTEAELLTALERLTAGRTTLIIAHRLSTIRKADRIVVLENGRITESGTHDQLMGLQGTYYRYCRLNSLEANLVAETPACT